ncbi:hypothetical protein SGPA1_30156 [Streptomyces misionensis JCM 4497]
MAADPRARPEPSQRFTEPVPILNPNVAGSPRPILSGARVRKRSPHRSRRTSVSGNCYNSL